MTKHYGFLFEPERCINCFACEVACQQWHNLKAGTVKLIRIEEKTSGIFPDVKRIFRAVNCLHCVTPRCMDACPEGAISKREEDGIVTVDRSKCTGCRACYEACRSHIPQFGEEGKMFKCDMCMDRLQNGWPPVCVATCPTQALHWGTLEELASFRKKLM